MKYDVEALFRAFIRENRLDITLSYEMPPGYEDAFGTFDITAKTLFLNRRKLEDGAEYELLFYFFHELRHAMQYLRPQGFSKAIQNSMDYVILYNGICFKLADGAWKSCRLAGEEAYFTRAYENLPYELDANRCARDAAKALLPENEPEIESLYRAWLPQEDFSEEEFQMLFRRIDKAVQERTEVMNIQEILSRVDHTLLKQEATWEQIKTICDDGVKYGCASVCIPASFVKRAAEYLGDKLSVCTVIGFPNGYSTTASKVFETEDAVKNGAAEIDMVANIGWIKEGRWDDLGEEIRAVKAASGGRVLKVIIETCLLTDEEKIAMCRVVTAAGADFIKTSTGFSAGGATREDVALFKAHVGPGVKIKAAGGIASLQDAEDFIALGAERLGTSRIVALVKG